MFFSGSDGGEFYPYVMDSRIDWLNFPNYLKPSKKIQSTNSILKGISYGNGLYRMEIYKPEAQQAWDRMLSLCPNAIQLTITNYQDSLNSSTIYADHLKTPTDRDLEVLVKECKDIRAVSQFRPEVLKINKISGYSAKPLSFDKESYRRCLLHYAELAQSLGVESFNIVDTGRINDEDYWKSVIFDIKSVYTGKVTAEFEYLATIPNWCQFLDFISFSFYPHRYEEEGKTIDPFKNVETVGKYCEKISKQVNKNFVISNIGIPVLADGNEDIQAELFNKTYSFFEKIPTFKGSFVQGWPNQVRLEKWQDTDFYYSIMGKKAEAEIKKYFLK